MLIWELDSVDLEEQLLHSVTSSLEKHLLILIIQMSSQKLSQSLNGLLKVRL